MLVKQRRGSRRVWTFTCDGCGRILTYTRYDVHDRARGHATECTGLAHARLRWAVREHADLLRCRAIVLLAAVEQQTRMTLPWVELRRVADELDELTGLVRTSQRITGDAIPVEQFQRMWHPYPRRAVAS